MLNINQIRTILWSSLKRKGLQELFFSNSSQIFIFLKMQKNVLPKVIVTVLLFEYKNTSEEMNRLNRMIDTILKESLLIKDIFLLFSF